MDRRIIIIFAVGISVFSLFIGLFIFGSRRASERGYVKTFSMLDMKDAGEVTSELKNIKIPYRSKQEEKGDYLSISVPREKADEARMSLAKKMLPKGGVMGFEIFDQTQLGTTDFDRRIKYIRALSGELSRNIRRLEGVLDARVQIVIPETQPFAEKSPTTAAVLLQLDSGKRLTSDQIDGIVHLVSSSVEGLSPQNVTVVDMAGYILAQKGVSKAVAGNKFVSGELEKKLPREEETVVVKAEEGEEVVSLEKKEKEEVKKEEKKEEAVKKAETEIQVKEKLSLAQQVEFKEKLERQYEEKIQTVLLKLFPPNRVFSRVNIDLKFPPNPGVKIARVKTTILIDKDIKLSKDLKRAIYDAVGAAIDYEKERGDIIELKRMPFYASSNVLSGLDEKIKSKTKVEPTPLFTPSESQKNSFFSSAFQKISSFSLNSQIIIVIVGLPILYIIFLLLRRLFGVKRQVGSVPFSRAAKENIEKDIEQPKFIKETEPEKIAAVLKKWLVDEGEA